jgi:hypothetical protein
MAQRAGSTTKKKEEEKERKEKKKKGENKKTKKEKRKNQVPYPSSPSLPALHWVTCFYRLFYQFAAQKLLAAFNGLQVHLLAAAVARTHDTQCISIHFIPLWMEASYSTLGLCSSIWALNKTTKYEPPDGPLES